MYITYLKGYITYLGCDSVLAVYILLVPHYFTASSQPFAVSVKSEIYSNLLKGNTAKLLTV